MPYTFRIVFSGLCAFVPNRPFDQSDLAEDQRNPPNSVDVLLRNLLEPAELASGEPIPHHVPRLEFRPVNRRGSSTRATDFLERPGTGDEMGYCVLRFEDVIFRRAGGLALENALSVTSPEPRNLVLLRRAGQPVYVDPNLLFPTLVPGENPLIARVKLGEGNFRTFDFQEGRWVYHPPQAPPPLPPSDRLARSLAVELFNVEGDVEILFNVFDRHGVETKLVLGPDPARPDDDVTIFIRNQEVEGLRGFLGTPASVQADHEYEAYFQLLAPPIPPAAELPIPHAEATTLIRSGGCTPTAMLRDTSGSGQ